MVQHKLYVNLIFFPQNAILAIAGDDDIVRLHGLRKKMVCEFKAHETRQVCV